MMKEKYLQKQLELLDVFMEMSAGLTWWLDGSSLFHYYSVRGNKESGAFKKLRIEIGMPRSDYEHYEHRAKKLQHPYFNKSHDSDMFPYGYSRLMDIETTALVLSEGEFWQQERRQGIYISIYPFDNVLMDDNYAQWLKEIKISREKTCRTYVLSNCGIQDVAIYEAWYKRLHECVTRYDDRETEMFANLVRMYKGRSDARKKKGYENLLKVDFYGRSVSVPHKSDFSEEDLMAGLFHLEKINKLDAEKPYTKYLFERKRLSDEEFLATLNLKIDKHFLQDEVRWGYKVNKEMKKVWAVELDLLHEFDRVCKKFGLQWWIDGGTMLGAIRHRGFIPWDDDVDVAMLRKDFDILLERHAEFQGKYFLQSFETDQFVMTKYRLLNLDTTAMGYANYVNPLSRFQMTGFIDIFAFENIKDVQDWQQRSRAKTSHKALADHFLKMYHLTNDATMLDKALKHFETHKCLTVGTCVDEDTELLANVTLTKCDDRFKRYREDYRETVYVPFEMLSLPCPHNWERCLVLQYGKNWREPIKGTQYHSCWIYDSDNAYDDYVNYLVRLSSS